MLMVLHGNDGVHTHNRGSKDILGATTHYTPVMTIKYGTALKSKRLTISLVNTMFTRLERTLPTITSLVLAPRRWLV